MSSTRQKIPFVLKLKRFKNSNPVRKINSFISSFFPPKKYNGIPGSILIFRNDRIGDAVVTLPVLRDIKLNYPDINIDILVSEVNKFVFLNSQFKDNIIEFKINGNETSLIYKLPILGGTLLAFKYIVFPFITSRKFRIKLKSLKKKKYDIAIDLVGLKRNSLISKYSSGFSAGPGRIFPFLFYDYYSGSNWVSPDDNDFMTRKIEKFIESFTGIEFREKNISIPVTNTLKITPGNPVYDIIFHFGGPDLRKLEYPAEKEIVYGFTDKKILITDSGESLSFAKLKTVFKDFNNISFKLFPDLSSLAEASLGAKILFCYDGGQSHFLSQYARTLTLFGPGSPHLWKPYEFSSYHRYSINTGKVNVMISRGKMKHVIMFYPLWCNPCFDTGCSEKPCIKEINVELIKSIITDCITGVC